MNLLLSTALFFANVMAFSITLSVFVLAFSQFPANRQGNSVIQFLIVLGFYNLAVLLQMGVLILNLSDDVKTIVVNLTVLGFALCIVASFSLLVSLAGMMKQAWLVIARAGVVTVIVLQWPLWTGKFFGIEAPYYMMSSYAPAGLVAVAVGAIYMALTIGLIVAYRQRLDLLIVLGVVVLLAGQCLAIIDPTWRQLGAASLFSMVATLILGYRLARMQLFNPLRMHWTQLMALKDMIRALTSKHSEAQIYEALVQQSRKVLSSDMSTIVVRRHAQEDKSGGDTIIAAQDGGPDGLAGRIMPARSGLAGHIFESKRPFRLQNYSTWENKSSAMTDIKMYAVMGVPMIFDDELLGVLLVAELKPGRTFSERDQALLEMLAPQAALTLVNIRLRQRLAALSQST